MSSDGSNALTAIEAATDPARPCRAALIPLARQSHPEFVRPINGFLARFAAIRPAGFRPRTAPHCSIDTVALLLNFALLRADAARKFSQTEFKPRFDRAQWRAGLRRNLAVA